MNSLSAALHIIAQIVAIVAGVGSLGGLGYYLLCMFSALKFVQRNDRLAAQAQPADGGHESRAEYDDKASQPPVSVLKPLRGVDPQMLASLRSHCQQDYAEYEIIFGVSDPADPALDAVAQLQQEFPGRSIQVVICPVVLGSNLKVSSLIQMLPSARYEHLLINDSDILVKPDYLRRVFAGFAEPPIGTNTTGLVTALYRGLATHSLPSQLEALGISTDFAGGVLAAWQLEGGLRFGLGSTLAVTKAGIARIGGLQAIVNHLADDYELGRRLHDAGYNIVLCNVVVETFLPNYNWREFFDHQLRWARNVRDVRRWGYLGILFTFGLPWAMLTFAAVWSTPWTPLAGLLLATVGLVRLMMALTLSVGILRDRQIRRQLWLVPLRDVIAMGLWFASFAGNTVVWRGVRFRLKDGKLTRI